MLRVLDYVHVDRMHFRNLVWRGFWFHTAM